MAWNEKIKSELGYCGKDVFIGENVTFTNPSSVFLMDRIRIDPYCLITTALEVGENTQICSHAVISGGKESKVVLAGWNFIGYHSMLFCASEDYSGQFGPVNDFWGWNKVTRGDIIFNKYAGIASGTVVMPCVELPEGCTIGAMSFVYKHENLTPFSVWLGNPLRLAKNRNKEAIIQLAEKWGAEIKLK